MLRASPYFPLVICASSNTAWYNTTWYDSLNRHESTLTQLNTPWLNRSLFPPLNSNETPHAIQIVSTAWAAWATMWLAQPTPHYSLSSQKSEGRLFWWVSPLIEATTLNPSCIKRTPVCGDQKCLFPWQPLCRGFTINLELSKLSRKSGFSQPITAVTIATNIGRLHCKLLPTELSPCAGES